MSTMKLRASVKVDDAVHKWSGYSKRKRALVIAAVGVATATALALGLVLNDLSQKQRSKTTSNPASSVQNTVYDSCENYKVGDQFAYEGLSCGGCKDESKEKGDVYFNACNHTCSDWKLKPEIAYLDPVVGTCDVPDYEPPVVEYADLCPPGYYRTYAKTGCKADTFFEILLFRDECMYCDDSNVTKTMCIQGCEQSETCSGYMISKYAGEERCYTVSKNMEPYCAAEDETSTYCEKLPSAIHCYSEKKNYADAKKACEGEGKLVPSDYVAKDYRVSNACKSENGCYVEAGNNGDCWYIQNYEKKLGNCGEERGYCCEYETDAPTYFPTESPGDEVYYTVPSEYPYDKAEEECKKKGAHLASIHDQHDQDLAWGVCKKALDATSNDCGCWLGFNKRQGDKFGWTDNSAVNYVNWETGGDTGTQPNNKPNELCTYFRSYSIGGWNDATCDGSCDGKYHKPLVLCKYETKVPTKYPTYKPTYYPTTGHPTNYPTTKYPTGYPTTGKPTEYPTTYKPTEYPTTYKPTDYPTTYKPTKYPTTYKPTEYPTTYKPTEYPTTYKPTEYPTTYKPTYFPTTKKPTGYPTTYKPTYYPTTKKPTEYPTTYKPTYYPTTKKPTEYPTTYKPTYYPTTYKPTEYPTTHKPTYYPTTRKPTDYPTTYKPTEYPTTKKPTYYPTTANPTDYPTTPKPTDYPTTSKPTNYPTTPKPTKYPTTGKPTYYPTTKKPTEYPTTAKPTDYPTTYRPTYYPTTKKPTEYPTTGKPTYYPTTKRPSNYPTTYKPTYSPTTPRPTYYPTTPRPTYYPTTTKPTDYPTTRKPTEYPTTYKPTEYPTTSNPTDYPTTKYPTDYPTTKYPTAYPTTKYPTDYPTTKKPTEYPTTYKPTEYPTTRKPTDYPTTYKPTEYPTTKKPTEYPTTKYPTDYPTTKKPTEYPTTYKPTEYPTTKKPTEYPTTYKPTEYPTTRKPTEYPTTYRPTDYPTTYKPTYSPTSKKPTPYPTTYKPTPYPTTKAPTDYPTTHKPTDYPTTYKPTKYPTNYPTTRQPTKYPTTYKPTNYPTTRKPTYYPTTSKPTNYPTKKPSEYSVCYFKNGEGLWQANNEYNQDMYVDYVYPRTELVNYAYDGNYYPYCSYNSDYCMGKKVKVEHGKWQSFLAPAHEVKWWYKGHCDYKNNYDQHCGYEVEKSDVKCKCYDTVYYTEDYESYYLGYQDNSSPYYNKWEKNSNTNIIVRNKDSFPGKKTDPCSKPGSKCIDVAGEVKTKNIKYKWDDKKDDIVRDYRKHTDRLCTVSFNMSGHKRCGKHQGYKTPQEAYDHGCLDYYPDEKFANEYKMYVKLYSNGNRVAEEDWKVKWDSNYELYGLTGDVYDYKEDMYVKFYGEGYNWYNQGKKYNDHVGNFIDNMKVTCCCVELFDKYVYKNVSHFQGKTGAGDPVPKEKSNPHMITNKPPNYDYFNTDYNSGSVENSQIYSLGIGGNVTYKFDSGFYEKLYIYEETVILCYPKNGKTECYYTDDNEDAKVEVSADGISWLTISNSLNGEHRWKIYDKDNDHSDRRLLSARRMDDTAPEGDDGTTFENVTEGGNPNSGDDDIEDTEFFFNNFQYQSFSAVTSASRTYTYYLKKIKYTKLYLPNDACFKYVRITDKSQYTNGYSSDADDGFDLHAIKTSKVCCNDVDNDYLIPKPVINDEPAIKSTLEFVIDKGIKGGSAVMFVIAAVGAVSLLALVSLTVGVVKKKKAFRKRSILDVEMKDMDDFEQKTREEELKDRKNGVRRTSAPSRRKSALEDAPAPTPSKRNSKVNFNDPFAEIKLVNFAEEDLAGKGKLNEMI